MLPFQHTPCIRVLRRLSFPLGAGKEGTGPKIHPPSRFSLSLSVRTCTLYKRKVRENSLFTKIYVRLRWEKGHRTVGYSPSHHLCMCPSFCEGVGTCMCACTREQGKLRLTILQTMHVGGVFSKRTLHHARDVRERAGRGSLSWHNMWNTLESKVQQPGAFPWWVSQEGHTRSGTIVQSRVQRYIYMSHTQDARGRGYFKTKTVFHVCVYVHVYALERKESTYPPASLGCGRIIKMPTFLHSRHVREKASQEVCFAINCVHVSVSVCMHVCVCICAHPRYLGQVCMWLRPRHTIMRRYVFMFIHTCTFRNVHYLLPIFSIFQLSLFLFQAPLWCLLFTQHCSKFFLYVSSLNPHKTSTR